MTSLYRPRKKLLSIILLGALIGVGTFFPAAADSSDNWAAPSAVSVRLVNSVQHDGHGRLPYEDNIDCEKISRKLSGTNQISTGCYVQTTYGSLDVRSNLLTFTSNPEAPIRLDAHGPHDMFLPWPGTPSVLVLTPVSAGGVYVGVYRDIIRSSNEIRNLLGKVVARKVTKPADIPLTYPDGSRIRANFNSIAFSDNGLWLALETMEGTFVRINLASLEIKSFARSFVGGGGRYDLSQLAVSNDGRHIAVANSGAATLKVYDLSKCFSAATSSECKSADYWQSVQAKDRFFQYAVHLRFINESLLSLIGIQNNIETSYLISPTASITSSVDYLALGDSYTSGEGAYGYRTGTDTDTNSCRVSNYAYPALISESLFTSRAGNSVACSGAKIQDIVNSNGYYGQTRDGKAMSDRSSNDITQILNQFTPGNLPQISFISHLQPAAVTLSIGGNDIAFGKMLQLCVAPQLSRHLSAANDCYATYEDRVELANLIDSQEARLVTLFKKVQQVSPISTVYVVGYPLIAVDTGNCALNVHLNTSEIALSIEVIKQLNAVIERSAKTADVSYVDIENALEGHRLCETKSSMVAVHGVTAGTDGGLSGSINNREVSVNFLGKESFHPNAYGHELIATAIKEQTKRLQLKKVPIATKPKAATPGSRILQAPKSNRPIKKKQPASISRKRSAVQGSKLSVSVQGKANGLRPNIAYSIILKDASKTTNLGNVTTDHESNIEDTLIPLPIVQPGNYEIGIIGEDQMGDDTVISDVITIINSEIDYDSDGIPNTNDSCLTIYNSGVDADQDGIDDVCDSIIDTSTSILPETAIVLPVSPSISPEHLGAAEPRPQIADNRHNTSRLTVSSASSKSHVLGVNSDVKPNGPSGAPDITKKAYELQPAASVQAGAEVTPQKWQTTAYRINDLWRIPWIEILLLTLAGIITFRIMKIACDEWRRKRDSNPRYP